jgi:excisionase family DNA binding protein
MNTTIFTQLSPDDLKCIIKECIKEEMSTYFSATKSTRPEYDMLTMEELGKQLGVTKVTIISWTKKGILKASKMGRRVFYKKDEIDKCLKDYNRETGMSLERARVRWANV